MDKPRMNWFIGVVAYDSIRIKDALPAQEHMRECMRLIQQEMKEIKRLMQKGTDENNEEKLIFKLETSEHQRTAIRSVVEVLLYPSFGAPLLLLWSPFRDSEPSRRCKGDLTEMSRNSFGGVRFG